jgi:hypothetical protein
MQTPRYDDYAVVLNSHREVLLIDDRIPCISDNAPHFWQTCESVNRAIAARYGLVVTTVRCLHTEQRGGVVANVYLMEYHDGDLPPGGCWVAPIALPHLDEPATAADIKLWLEWFVTEHPNRPAWYQPGFYQRLTESLAARVDAPAQALEQVRSWERSSVWRVRTHAAELYYKAVPAMFRHEPRLMDWLAAQFPDECPAVCDFHPGEAVLMPAYVGTPLMAQPDLVSHLTHQPSSPGPFSLMEKGSWS